MIFLIFPAELFVQLYFKLRTVQSILNTKEKAYNTVGPGTRVIDALNFMNAINLSYLVVMDDQKFMGLFTERDYSRNIILKGRNSSTTTVGEALSTDLPVVDPDESLESCMKTMNSHKVRYLVVFDDQSRFRGVITMNDLLRQVLKDKEEVFDQTRKASRKEDEDRVF